jgi:pimeloyl-ACP methyl ester carboxylesterase
MPADTSTMTTSDGRRLEYRVTGQLDGPAVVFHTGTPGATVDFSAVTAAATALGLRLVGYSRPGYGRSTERPGRSVGDVAEDVTALLDELGVDEFRAFGWSGGGPHALACAALLPDRCRATALLASVAPYAARGLDWMDGMDQSNVDEFTATLAGVDALDAFLQPFVESLRKITGPALAEEFGGLLSSVDKAAVTGTFAEELALSIRGAVENGIAGWRDDDLAFARDWGFGLSGVSVPVAVWQGRQDRMVPYAHGEWLAAEIPTAEAHLFEDEGHVSLIAQVDRILADLATLGE